MNATHTYGTPGYAALMAEIRMDDIKHDPWGTAMGWLFAMATAVYVRFDDILPAYRPSSLIDIDNYTPDGAQEESLFGQLDNGQLTEADLRAAYATLSRFDDWCRAAGRDY